jgi:hypothetical protein
MDRPGKQPKKQTCQKSSTNDVIQEHYQATVHRLRITVQNEAHVPPCHPCDCDDVLSAVDW